MPDFLTSYCTPAVCAFCMVGGRTCPWNPLNFSAKRHSFCARRYENREFVLKFHRFAQMTLTSCRAIINWFDLSGFDRVNLLSVWICGGRFCAFRPLRDKDFSRCTSRGTLTAEARKNGCKNRAVAGPKNRSNPPEGGLPLAERTNGRRPDFREQGTIGRATTPGQAPIPVTHTKFFGTFFQESTGMAKGRRESGIHAEPRRPSRNDRQLRTRRNTLCRSLIPSQTC